MNDNGKLDISPLEDFIGSFTSVAEHLALMGEMHSSENSLLIPYAVDSAMNALLRRVLNDIKGMAEMLTERTNLLDLFKKREWGEGNFGNALDAVKMALEEL